MFDASFQSDFQATARNLSGLYVVGGTGRSHSPENFDGHKLAVENYRPDSDMWIVRGNTRIGRSNGGAWGFGADGALVGGGNYAVDPAPEQETLNPIREIVAVLTASVGKFIPPDTWVAHQSLGATRADFATSVIGDSGWGYGGTQGFSGGSFRSRDIWAVRPYTSIWVAPQGRMPTGRDGATAGTIGDKGYVAGGGFDFSSLGNRDIYEWVPATETVNVMVPGPATGEGALRWRVADQTGGAVDDSLYLFGGRMQGVSNIIQQYTPATNITKSLTHSPAPTANAASFTDDHGIYQVGGATQAATQEEAGLMTNNTNAVLRFDTISHTWSTVAPLVGMLLHDKRWMWEPNGPNRQSAIGFNV